MREQAGPTANVDWGPSFEVIGASLEAAAEVGGKSSEREDPKIYRETEVVSLRFTPSAQFYVRLPEEPFAGTRASSTSSPISRAYSDA
jgi:hypothetical protein